MYHSTAEGLGRLIVSSGATSFISFVGICIMIIALMYHRSQLHLAKKMDSGRYFRKSVDGSYMRKVSNYLPAGWEVGATEAGRIYFIDHKRCETTWSAPNNINVAQETVPHAHFPSAEIPNLPPGWDVDATLEGVPYFINHATKSTSWIHPCTQKPAVMSTQYVYVHNDLLEQSHGGPPLPPPTYVSQLDLLVEDIL